jgi:hypothetical protein
MYFVRISDTSGVNLSHILAWFDSPNAERPFVRVVTMATAETEHGHRTPHTMDLVDQDRTRMLHWLDQARVGPDWKAAYEEARDLMRTIEQRMRMFEAALSEAEAQRVWEAIYAREKRGDP